MNDPTCVDCGVRWQPGHRCSCTLDSLRQRIIGFRAEIEALKKERDGLAMACAELQQFDNWEADCGSKAHWVGPQMSFSDPKAILKAHHAAKDAEIAALSAGLRLAHDQMCGAGFDQIEIEKTCGLDACKRALAERDKPLVEVLNAYLADHEAQIQLDCKQPPCPCRRCYDARAALAPHKADGTGGKKE